MNNPQLFGSYLLCKEELEATNDNEVEEKILYHATSELNAREIAKNNIDWRRTRRARFGIGACFSSCPRYAHQYSSQSGGL